MGGQSSQTQQQQQTTTRDPYAPAVPLVSGIAQQGTGLLGQTGFSPLQQQGYNQLIANAQAGNPYAGAIGGYATNLLSGGGVGQYMPQYQQALETYRSQLAPYASGQNVGQISPALASMLATNTADVTNQINSQFAGAGRDLSGLNQQAVARGITQANAPLLAQQYNTDVQRQLEAAQQLFGAGTGTTGALAGLNQQQLANMGQGVDAATAALQARDAAAQQQFNLGGLPFGTQTSNLAQLAQLGIPIAGLGGTATGTGSATTTYNPSLASQIQGWGNFGMKAIPFLLG